ncbi:MAG: hypothetical protein QM499_04010 [Flavobacteriaceae bacterium]
MKNIIKILFMCFALVGYSQGEPSVVPKITIKIALGETITIEHNQVKFVKVLEDSRCPKGVTCIWAGRAKVLVEINEEGKELIQKELIFGQVNQGESKDLTLFTSEGNIVKGYALKPYPSSEVSSDEREYILLIIEEKQ